MNLLLQKALDTHQAGDLKTAEKYYLEILHAQPNETAALQGLEFCLRNCLP